MHRKPFIIGGDFPSGPSKPRAAISYASCDCMSTLEYLKRQKETVMEIIHEHLNVAKRNKRKEQMKKRFTIILRGSGIQYINSAF